MSYNKLIKNFALYSTDENNNFIQSIKYASVIALNSNSNISIPQSNQITDWRIITCPEIPMSSGQYQLNVNAKDIVSSNLLTMGRVSNIYSIYRWNSTLNIWVFSGNLSVRKWEWYFEINITDESQTHYSFQSLQDINGENLPSEFDFTNNEYQIFIEKINIDRNIIISSVTNNDFDISISPAGDSLPVKILFKIEKV